MFDHSNAVNKIFDRVHRTGEEVKNDLPNWVERAVENKTWQQSINPATGEHFATVGEWLVASWPLGPGMGQGKHAITYDEFIVLCENRPNLKKLLIESRPKRREGRPTKVEQETLDNVKSLTKPIGGNHRAYLEDRLSRDYPQHWQDYIDGKYRSARQAAIAAGICKEPTQAEICVKAFCKTENRIEALKLIIEQLQPHEKAILAEVLSHV